MTRLCSAALCALLAALAVTAGAAETPTPDPVMLAADPQGVPLATPDATPGATQVNLPVAAPAPAAPILPATQVNLPVAAPAVPAVTPASLPQPAPAAAAAPIAPGMAAAPAPALQASVARPASAGTPERRVWDRAPVPVVLAVGEERLILMPATMRLGIPTAVAGSLRSQVLGRSVYLTALKPFPATRVIAESPETGQAILLDLSAGKRAIASHQPLEILLPEQIEAAAPALHATVGGEADEPVIDPLILTRFAAHQIYAPRRLATPAGGVRQVGVARTALPHLYRGARLHAEPLASWRGGDLTVTAVKLVNRGAQPLELDPRQLDGKWLAATFQHARLSPAHSERDTTAVYLVCDRPFGECL